MYIGTTAVAINRASAALNLTLGGGTFAAGVSTLTDSSAVSTTPLVIVNNYGTSADQVVCGITMGRSAGTAWGGIFAGQQNASNYNYGSLFFKTKTSDALGLETKLTISAGGTATFEGEIQARKGLVSDSRYTYGNNPNWAHKIVDASNINHTYINTLTSLYISTGAKYYGAGLFLPDSTNFVGMIMNPGGEIAFYNNTGLTAGTSFTPTKVATISSAGGITGASYTGGPISGTTGTFSSNIETTGAGNGLILKDASNGNRYRIYSNNGTLTMIQL